MMKKLHLSRVLFMASLITLFAISCKKDQAADNPVEDAKSWYLKATANTKSNLKSNRGAVKNITQDIQWDDAKLYNLEDGTEVLGTPMVITLDKGVKAKGSYMLFISKNNGAYSSLVAYNENKDYFNGSLTALAVQNIYKNTLELSLAHKDMSVSRSNSNPNNKLMTLPAGGYCIDWYLTTYMYDEWGNIVEILSEIYLYTTCPEEGGGGGGGVDPDPEPEPEPTFTWGEVDDSDGFNTLLSIDTVGSEIHNINWTCYKINGNQLWFQSYEKVYIKKINAVVTDMYQFDKTVHQNITATGELDSGQSAELLLNVATDLSTPEYAQMELSVKERRTITQNNKTTVKISGSATARSKAWSLSRFGH